MGSWLPTLRATAAIVLAWGHAAAQASYGNMGLGQDPPWFLFLAAAVLALPGGLLIFILEASLGWRKLPRGTGLVFAVAMAAFVYNAFFPGLVTASARRELHALFPFLMPVLGTLMLLGFGRSSGSKIGAAWGLAIFGAAVAHVSLRQGSDTKTALSATAILMGGMATSMASWHLGHLISRQRRPVETESDAWFHLPPKARVMAGWAWRWVAALRKLPAIRHITSAGLLAVALSLAIGPFLHPLSWGWHVYLGHGGEVMWRLVAMQGEQVLRCLVVGVFFGVAWLALDWDREIVQSRPAFPHHVVRRGILALLMGLAYYALVFTGWGRFSSGAAPIDSVLLNALLVVALFVALDTYRSERVRAWRAACALLGFPLAFFVASTLWHCLAGV